MTEQQQIPSDQSAGDLRRAYLLAFDNFDTNPTDLGLEFGDNPRYARELLATLQAANLVVLAEDGEGSEAYQVSNPGTYDNHERDEAEKVIDAWLDSVFPEQPSSAGGSAPRQATKADSVSGDGAPCLCGCGEPTGKKSNYRPGHDARHAGQVGRQIARDIDQVAMIAGQTLLQTLPSALLREKAAKIAETEFNRIVRIEQRELDKERKAEGKAHAASEKAITQADLDEVADAVEKVQAEEPTEPQPVEGTATVGKNEVLARRWPNGLVEVLKNDEFVKASKSATASFQVG